jgi:hypothetical protein
MSRVVLLAMALLVAGCAAGGSDRQATETANVVRVPERPLKPAAPSSTTPTDRFARGLPPRIRSTRPVPPAPNTLGALAMASIPAVVGVHNVASSVGRPLGLPRGALHAQAVDLRGMLGRLGSQLRRSPQGVRAELATVLSGYLGIANDLARRAEPLAASARRRLAALDVRWRRALRTIGRRSGSDLADAVPSLPRPHIPAPVRRVEGQR